MAYQFFYILKLFIIAFVSVLCIACRHVDCQTLAEEIQMDYQCAIDREYNLYASTGVFDNLDNDLRPIVQELNVYHVISDMYIGIAKIEIAGEQQLKAIYITANEDSISWEVPEYDVNIFN